MDVYVFLVALLLLPIAWPLSLCIFIGWVAYYYFEHKKQTQFKIETEVRERERKLKEDRLLHDIDYIKETAEDWFFRLSPSNPLASEMQLVRTIAVPISKITRVYENASISGFVLPDRAGNSPTISVERGFDAENRLVAVARSYVHEIGLGVSDFGVPMSTSMSKHERIFLLNNGVSAKLTYAYHSGKPVHTQFDYGDFIGDEEKLSNTYRFFKR